MAVKIGSASLETWHTMTISFPEWQQSISSWPESSMLLSLQIWSVIVWLVRWWIPISNASTFKISHASCSLNKAWESNYFISVFFLCTMRLTISNLVTYFQWTSVCDFISAGVESLRLWAEQIVNGNASSCLIRQTGPSTCHGLHFTNFNPSSFPHCSSTPPLSFLNLLSPPLGPSHSLYPLNSRRDYIFHLGSKIRRNCSQREEHAEIKLFMAFCLCVREPVCAFNRTEMVQQEAVDLVGKQ